MSMLMPTNEDLEKFSNLEQFPAFAERTFVGGLAAAETMCPIATVVAEVMVWLQARHKDQIAKEPLDKANE